MAAGVVFSSTSRRRAAFSSSVYLRGTARVREASAHHVKASPHRVIFGQSLTWSPLSRPARTSAGSTCSNPCRGGPGRQTARPGWGVSERACDAFPRTAAKGEPRAGRPPPDRPRRPPCRHPSTPSAALALFSRARRPPDRPQPLRGIHPISAHSEARAPPGEATPKIPPFW